LYQVSFIRQVAALASAEVCAVIIIVTIIIFYFIFFYFFLFLLLSSSLSPYPEIILVIRREPGDGSAMVGDVIHHDSPRIGVGRRTTSCPVSNAVGYERTT